MEHDKETCGVRLRSLIGQPIKWALARVGYDVFAPAKYYAVPRKAYGHDPYLDIQRLSQAWQYSIDFYFDVGASNGLTISRARERFGNCRIVAFEPHPKTFLNLTEYMRIYKVSNVQLINLALGSKSGDAVMFEYDNPTCHSLLPNAQAAVRFGLKELDQIQVHCTTLDDFCSAHGIKQIDVLKIDTEGLDFDVLNGARSLLAQQAIKFIYFEFNDISSRSDASGGALAPIHHT